MTASASYRSEPGLEAELLAAARDAHPREACGLLLGRRLPGGHGAGGLGPVLTEGVHFVAARPSRNLAEREDRFRVHPEDHLAAEREARARGLEVLGAWHSHPRGTAQPSAADRAGSPSGWWLAIVGEVPSAERGGARRSEAAHDAQGRALVVRFHPPVPTLAGSG